MSTPTYNTEDIAKTCYDFTERFVQACLGDHFAHNQDTPWKQRLRNECYNRIAQYVKAHDEYPSLGLSLMCEVLSQKITENQQHLGANKTIRDDFLKLAIDVTHNPTMMSKFPEFFTYDKKPFDLKDVQNEIMHTAKMYADNGSIHTRNFGAGNLSTTADEQNHKALRVLMKEIVQGFSKDLSPKFWVDQLQEIIDQAHEYAKSMNSTMTGTFSTTLGDTPAITTVTSYGSDIEEVLIEDDNERIVEFTNGIQVSLGKRRARAEQPEQLAQPTRTQRANL